MVLTDIEFDIEYTDELGQMMYALDSEAKIHTYELLGEGWSQSEIAEELGMSNSSIHSYKEMFAEMGWIDEENDYTKWGEFVFEHLQRLDEEYSSMKIQQAKREMRQAVTDLSEINGIDLDSEKGERLKELLELNEW